MFNSNVTVLSVLWWYNVTSDARLSDISMIYLQYVHSDSNVDVWYENVLKRATLQRVKTCSQLLAASRRHNIKNHNQDIRISMT